ncbi:MAG: plasmid replication, integration and excision activator [Pseudonocardiaceae bacterium]|nr:plasmid replication, integration and excision activator [Pseudonocardiaceae bacterium]
MAISRKISMSHDEAFPQGAFVVTDVEKVRDFDQSTADNFVQQLDKDTGLPLWEVGVHDADPMARKANRQITVKIAAEVQPVPPEAVPGTPFRPVEFEGLTATPYIDDKACKPAAPGERHRCRARIAYSFRATGMRAPSKGGGRSGGSTAGSNAAGSDGKAAA